MISDIWLSLPAGPFTYLGLCRCGEDAGKLERIFFSVMLASLRVSSVALGHEGDYLIV